MPVERISNAKAQALLGMKIEVNHRLRRVSSYLGAGKGTHKGWVDHRFREPKNVMIVGIRTLTNGRVRYDYDAPPEYEATEAFTALMVVEHIRRKPFFVRLDPDHPAVFRGLA